MNDQSRINDVASFYYSFNGPQTIAFENFINHNKSILRKISKYDYEDWNVGIRQFSDLQEVLCFLVVNFGYKYKFVTAKSTEARFHLLQIWEKNWGTLPNKWRVGFVRHPRFKEIQFMDVEILEYMFSQHRKFSTIIEHLVNLQINTTLNQISSDFNEIELESIATSESDSEPNFDLDSITLLSSETEIPLDWNIDDLDTDDILPVWEEEFSY